MSAPVSFPAPIGGVPFDNDFTPSVFFALLYAAVCLLGFWRLAREHSRTMLVVTTLIFTIERVVVWLLRAKQAKTPSDDLSKNLTAYWQMTFSANYIAMYGKLIVLLKSLVMDVLKPVPAPIVLQPGNFTQTADPEASTSFLHHSSQQDKYREVPSNESKTELVEREGDLAAAHKRKIFTRISTGLGLQALLPVLTGLVMSQLYVGAETNASKANIVRLLRFAIAGMCFAILMALQGMCFWARRLPGIRKTPLMLIVALGLILTIIPSYHLFIMGNNTTSLISTAPGSGNTPAEKTAFYVFQVMVELVTSGTLLGINAKEVFGL
ncbi:uncharacterized protein PHACADRAFT_196746 [Phanerochaete carnosa HHB-10118-sp]|uniref:Uncharacterized protein n=1 Tax=Phanerochaete carnosa (strain HHB-10118-sp) TaxID=650164 RepID=K5W5D5_PHACS|nr:uncharacterized protein PHACADRAFT_196746 [Phanerochaete carnosa HHB-10118-sp]EKM54315.1 hypothetical protein PHACADRAFT_196746 [Phanerochaete carnosa HHB-10118-sp]